MLDGFGGGFDARAFGFAGCFVGFPMLGLGCWCWVWWLVGGGFGCFGILVSLPCVGLV